MIVVKLMGGLGNQMFQFAYAKAMSKKYNTMTGLDLDFLNNTPENTVKRKLGLLSFNIKIGRDFEEINKDSFFSKMNKEQQLGTWSQFLNTFKKRHRIPENIHYLDAEKNGPQYDEKQTSIKENTYAVGYFQSEDFFINIKDDIYNYFQAVERPSDYYQSLIDQCQSTESVAVHVRRGDYVGHPVHDICGMAYYQKAFEIIKTRKKKLTFYVFSDDISWCKQAFASFNFDFNYVESVEEKEYEDIRLMSLCKHNIIHNSSFSWWGAWLNRNDNKIVICPDKWFLDSRMISNLSLERWTKVQV